MDAYECIATKLDVREFSSQNVSRQIKSRVLESARLTGTGLNTQHWRFIVIEDKENLTKLADDSTSGSWVAEANFAVIVLTNPKYRFHIIDAGRVVQDMSLAAWNYGVVSCVFTGMKESSCEMILAFLWDFSLQSQLDLGTLAKDCQEGRRTACRWRNLFITRGMDR